jgi:hypothetical protein
MITMEKLSTVFNLVPGKLCLGILLCSLLSCMSEKKETKSESNIDKEIIIDTQKIKFTSEVLAQEKAWASALVVDNLNFVDSIMHNDFRLIRAYGDAPPISKDMYLGMKGMSVSSAEVMSFAISSEMDSVVVARTTWTLDWEQEGIGKLSPHFDMIDIWKKNEDGLWQILSRVSQILNEPVSNKYRTD